MMMFMALAAAGADVPNAKLCQQGLSEKVVCVSWAKGISDGLIALTIARHNQIDICLPDVLSPQDILDTIVAADAAHADLVSQPREIRLAIALHDRWPCPPPTVRP